ncbi:hypothetical protein NC651_019612 [Populus alba x Populus x berolinensis]|nr:hypothetical protein NC651_019612 [Populus alba x Populus x berolinensis]
MSRAARISLFLFTSILLLFTISWFSPVSHLPSSLPGVLSFFKHLEDTFIFESNTRKDVYHDEGTLENQGTNSWPENPVVDEKDVVVLTEKNFGDFIATNPYVMVEFYASWCHWSRKLAPEYSAAATLLKGEAVLAKVDATVEMGLGRKYKIQVSFSAFICWWNSKGDAIATWMRQKNGLAVQTVSTTEEANRILRTNSVIIPRSLLLLPDCMPISISIKLIMLMLQGCFALTHKFKPPALVIQKWEAANRSHVGFDGQFTESEISDFVSTNSFQFTKSEISDSVSTNNAPSVITFTLWLFSTKCSLELISTFEEAAKAFRNKVLVFVHVETDGTNLGLGANLAFQFGVPEGSPRVVACMANGDKYLYHGEMTFDGIKSFAEEFLEDNLSIHSVPISKSALRLPSDSHQSSPSLFSRILPPLSRRLLHKLLLTSDSKIQWGAEGRNSHQNTIRGWPDTAYAMMHKKRRSIDWKSIKKTSFMSIPSCAILLRTPEVCREAVVLSMEITILLGGALLFYTILLILQQIFSYTGVILLSTAAIVLLTQDHSSNSSLPITTARKLMEISKQLCHIVVSITNKLCEEPVTNYPHLERRCSGTIAIWTGYVAYAGGLIAIAVCANHTFLFSCMWDSIKRKSLGQNLDLADSMNKVDENELKEVKAKCDEDRQRWEEEKKDLTEQLNMAKSKLSEKEKSYSIQDYELFLQPPFTWIVKHSSVDRMDAAPSRRKSLGQKETQQAPSPQISGSMEANRGQNGIQLLLAAEQEAQHIVNTARNAKMARLRQAKEEAEKEIAEFRAHMEAEFQRKLTESSGDSGANVKRLEHETEAKIGHLKTEASRISNDVVQMLLKHVTAVKN